MTEKSEEIQALLQRRNELEESLKALPYTGTTEIIRGTGFFRRPLILSCNRNRSARSSVGRRPEVWPPCAGERAGRFYSMVPFSPAECGRTAARIRRRQGRSDTRKVPPLEGRVASGVSRKPDDGRGDIRSAFSSVETNCDPVRHLFRRLRRHLPLKGKDLGADGYIQQKDSLNLDSGACIFLRSVIG